MFLWRFLQLRQLAAGDQAVEVAFGDEGHFHILLRILRMRYVAFCDTPTMLNNCIARVRIPQHLRAVRGGEMLGKIGISDYINERMRPTEAENPTKPLFFFAYMPRGHAGKCWHFSLLCMRDASKC